LFDGVGAVVLASRRLFVPIAAGDAPYFFEEEQSCLT
jgi:hypothetical protein